MQDISTLSSSFIGAAVPFLVQFVRSKWLPWKGKAAIWLSLLISAGCVGAAYWQVDATPTLTEGLANLGLAFTLSQVVFHHMEDQLKGGDSPEEGP